MNLKKLKIKIEKLPLKFIKEINKWNKNLEIVIKNKLESKKIEKSKRKKIKTISQPYLSKKDLN